MKNLVLVLLTIAAGSNVLYASPETNGDRDGVGSSTNGTKPTGSSSLNTSHNNLSDWFASEQGVSKITPSIQRPVPNNK